MDLSKYRKLFPITTQKIYLNHAAISPFSIRVTDRMEWYLDERSIGNIDSFPEVNKIRRQTRELIAKMINAKAESIAFITNTSEGFNHLVNGLNWREGDEILIPDCEFPSNVYPFKNLERHGVKIKLIPSRSGLIDPQDIKKLISARTRLLSVSYVEFSNGFRNNLEAIGQLCEEHDIIFSVDSIQGLGALPLNVETFRIDFLSNGGHKWLMGPMGAGFMYISPGLFSRLQPAYTGWLAVEDAWNFLDYRLDFLPDARRYEYATANFMGIVGLSASVELLMEVGLNNIENHLLQLGEILVNELEQVGMEFVNSKKKEHWSGIYSFKGKDTDRLYEYLSKQKIVCSLRNGRLRIAPHFYNTKEEIQEVVNQIRAFYAE
ncbi:MAG: aminotransferase class V-fold PLP-dependent enzyme [Calditrichaeota bacterium]|nr:aminotransferase class V-fold PLP-dependent enzyme [Calditrichota bacterium]